MSDQDPGVDPQTSEPGSDTNGQEPSPDTFTRDYVEKLRAESASYRVRARDAEQKLEGFTDYDDLKAAAAKWQELEDQNKSELEKIQGQYANLEKQYNDLQSLSDQRLIQAAFIAEASKAGFANPEDAYMLADRSKVQINKDGTVAGVEDAIKGLEGRLPMTRQAAPNLDGGAGSSSRGNRVTKTEGEIREEAARLGVDAKLYAEAWNMKLTD